MLDFQQRQQGDNNMKMWIPCSTEEDPFYAMLNALVRIAKSSKSECCPLCNEGQLKFYYHEFPVKVKPVNRGGTLWVWCSSCMRWNHTSGITVHEADKLQRLDNEKVVQEERRHNLIEYLEGQWLAGKIGELSN
ncbi:hypothetical protein SAMN02745181_0486 [Rubritalea squalenifaciens DSM 18772]|uniref:Uncharacterized protein n=1 Tax=Rubritalea squalenifaciens DSM 18772 TaxID=1123071 RepID=A0A1M6CII2_9BACT|nr:hypothetical protein SAMN02745181_0486 [Rubritalea squalenifaciens DSM 18772]